MMQFTAEPVKEHARILDEFSREVHGERDPVSHVEDAVRALWIWLASVASKNESRTVSLAEIG